MLLASFQPLLPIKGLSWLNVSWTTIACVAAVSGVALFAAMMFTKPYRQRKFEMNAGCPAPTALPRLPFFTGKFIFRLYTYLCSTLLATIAVLAKLAKLPESYSMGTLWFGVGFTAVFAFFYGIYICKSGDKVQDRSQNPGRAVVDYSGFVTLLGFSACLVIVFLGPDQSNFWGYVWSIIGAPVCVYATRFIYVRSVKEESDPGSD
jgi:hypothetical protein